MITIAMLRIWDNHVGIVLKAPAVAYPSGWGEGCSVIELRCGRAPSESLEACLGGLEDKGISCGWGRIQMQK